MELPHYMLILAGLGALYYYTQYNKGYYIPGKGVFRPQRLDKPDPDVTTVTGKVVSVRNEAFLNGQNQNNPFIIGKNETKQFSTNGQITKRQKERLLF